MNPKDISPTQQVTNALAVMVLDAKIRAFLQANDPKALEQAVRALKRVGFQIPADVVVEA